METEMENPFNYRNLFKVGEKRTNLQSSILPPTSALLLSWEGEISIPPPTPPFSWRQFLELLCCLNLRKTILCFKMPFISGNSTTSDHVF
ncbi:hypothetical protein CEXT_179971 [Caerostris extrusa]|uniref:Uncharacterized protein n=1 Tax=Caerostris extrusa TaxID=172846 RepID=A0AAV4QG22_CAEEX|nr:hypothetical protein CEXT_179971 [Caerostris extrusa]